MHVSVTAQEERRLKKVQQELTAAREARVVPVGDAAALVEYMLDTAAEEMTFEISRCRPHLVRAWHSRIHARSSATCECCSLAPRVHCVTQNEAFFAHLTEAIKTEKFSSRSRVERVTELEGLLSVVEVCHGKCWPSSSHVTLTRFICASHPLLGRGEEAR